MSTDLYALTPGEVFQLAQAQAKRIAALEREQDELIEEFNRLTEDRVVLAMEVQAEGDRRRNRALRWAWSNRRKLSSALQSLDVAYGWLTTASAERDAWHEHSVAVAATHNKLTGDLMAARAEIGAHFAARMQVERERDLLASESARLRAALDEATEIIVNLLDQHADACGACDDAESRLGPEDVRELDRARQKRRRADPAGKEKP